MAKNNKAMISISETKVENAFIRLMNGNTHNFFQDLKEATKSKPDIQYIIQQNFEHKLIDDTENQLVIFELSKYLFFLGKLQEAEEELRDLLEMGSQDLEVYNLLISVLSKKDNNQELIEIYEAAYTNVKDDDIVDGLINTYIETQQYEKAISVYNSYLEHSERTPTKIKILAELYTYNEQYVESAKTYMMLLSRDKNWADEVIKRFEELLNLCDDIYIRLALADAYISVMKPDNAIEQYELVVKESPEQLEEIVKKIKRILLNYPDNIGVMITLAYMNIDLGQYSESVMYFSKLLKISPKYAEEAISGFLKVLSLIPEQVLARQYLAETYLLEGKANDAFKEYADLLDYNSGDISMVIAKCKHYQREVGSNIYLDFVMLKSYYLKEDYKKAVETGKELLEVNDINDDYLIKNTYFMIISSAIYLNDNETAITLMKNSLETLQNDSQLHEFVASKMYQILNYTLREKQLLKTTSALYDSGVICYEKADYEEALRSFQQSVREPSYASMSYMYMGMCFKETGRYDLAVNQFNKASEMLSESKKYDLKNKVQYFEGLCYEMLGEIPKAIKCYEYILERNIDYSRAGTRISKLNSIGWLDYDGKSLCAVVNVDKKLQVLWVPNIGFKRKKNAVGITFSQSHNDTGTEYFLKGRIKASQEEFELALKLEEDYIIGMNNLALLHIDKNELSLAEDLLNKIIEIHENIPAALANLGILKMLQGHFDHALEYLEKAVKFAPEFSFLSLNIGDILYEQGQVSKAIAIWKNAYERSILPESALRRLRYRDHSYFKEETLI